MLKAILWCAFKAKKKLFLRYITNNYCIVDLTNLAILKILWC